MHTTFVTALYSAAEVRFSLVLEHLNVNTKLDHQLHLGKEGECWTGPL